MDETIEVPFDEFMSTKLAEEFLLEAQRHPRDNSKIRASTIGNCPREISYSILGYEGQPKDSHSEFTFWIGHTLGDAMTYIFIRLGFLKAEPFINESGVLDWRGNTEEEVEDEHFKGHYDLLSEPLSYITVEYEGKKYKDVVVDYENGKRYLIDFKTMTDRTGFVLPQDEEGNNIVESKISRKGNEYIPLKAPCAFPGTFTKLDGIPENYWEQIHIYSRIKEADGIMLIVMAKDADAKLCYTNPNYLLNFPVKVYTFDGLDQKTLDKVDEKARYIYSYTDKGQVCPIPPEMEEDKFPCICCQFNYLCYPHKYKLKKGLKEVRPIAFNNLVVERKS